MGLGFTASGAAAAQSTRILAGTVGDAADGRGVNGATVRLDRTFTTVTDASGTFTLPAIPLGTYQMTVSAVGYAEAAFELALDSTMPTRIDLGFVPLRRLPRVAVSLTGTVVDSGTVRAVPNAQVLLNEDTTVTTDADGRFDAEVRLHPGPHLVLVRAVGYRLVGYELTVGDGGPVTLDVSLPRAPLRLEGIQVTETEVVVGQLAGFVERMRSEIGQFLTPADIDRVRDDIRTVSDLLIRVPGVTVRPTNRGRVVSFLRCGRPEIFVDGIPVEANYLDDAVDIQSLAAVEVYVEGGRIPAQFNRLQRRRGASNFGACGAIILHTRTAGRADEPG